jgi:hypothetical protein
LPSFVGGETLGRVIEIREERITRSITIREDCDDCPPIEARPRGPANVRDDCDDGNAIVVAAGSGLARRGMPRPRPDEEVAR